LEDGRNLGESSCKFGHGTDPILNVYIDDDDDDDEDRVGW